MKNLLVFTLLVLISFSVKADETQKLLKSIEVLKDKISQLEVKNQVEIIDSQFFDASKVDERLLSLEEELADKYHRLAQLQGRVIDLSESAINQANTYSAVALTVTPQTGDILVFKPKSNIAEWWAFAGQGWQHSAIFYSNSYIVQAVGPNTNAVKTSWSNFIANKPFSLFDQVILIKMNLTSSEISSMQFYQNTFQVGKPYPPVSLIPFTKYSIDTFYCSSLVWASHKWSAKKVDLDTVASPAMVWPVDLLLSSDYSQHYSISW